MTEELKQTIIKDYLNGKSISQLKRENPNIPYRQIQKVLTDNNITIRGGRKKKTLTSSQLNSLKTDFENGIIYDELSNKYNLDKETLRNIIKENCFTRPNNNRINKRILSNYFQVIDTPEKAYWLGLLYTDGSVDHYHQSGRIRLQLQEKDLETLNKLKNTLCLDCKLIKDERKNSICYSLEFTDEQIFNDLLKYGIMPQKTYKSQSLPYQNIPEKFLSAYLLGLFDGDGCLTYSEDCSTDVTFGFTSYYEQTVKDFQMLIDNLINKDIHNTPIFTSAWHINWRGRVQVLSILDKLYSSCPIHMERKYQKYLILKNSLK